VIFLLAILGFFAYILVAIIREFTGPNGPENFLTFLKGFGICLGVVVFALILFFLVALLSSRKRKVDLIRASPDYPARCDSFELHPNEAAKQTEISDARSAITVEVPVYLLLAITNQGLRFAPFPAEKAPGEIMGDNAHRYQAMFLGRADPVILPPAGYFLYFRRYQRVDQGYIERQPAQVPGQYGELPPDIGDDRITIVFTNTAIMDEMQPYPPVYHSRPAGVMFTLVVLGADGDEDPALTRKVYSEMVDYFKPSPDSSYEDYYG
jgi:hypothetical protein